MIQRRPNFNWLALLWGLSVSVNSKINQENKIKDFADGGGADALGLTVMRKLKIFRRQIESGLKGGRKIRGG
jgi:hypothetical protein